MRRPRLIVPALLLIAACNSTCSSCSKSTRSTGSATEDAEASRSQTLRPRPPAVPAPADVASPPADAETTQSGVAYKILAPGTGATHPGPKDTVTVHQTGWTKAGVMFDSSVSRGKPVTFRVDRVIRGWQEVLERMVVGEKVRAWVPAKLAYGDAPPGAPGVDQGATPYGDVVFEIELLDIQPAPKAP